ncbi:MAG: hypothetical protein K2L38_11350, partial [Dysosmobacter sp.]|nr:hypothetical protein [Dysosmobacter sp.]
MSSSGEVNESLARLIQEYLTAKAPEGVTDAVQWLGQFSLIVNTAGKIVIPVMVAEKLGEFAVWVAGKYGTKPGVNEVYGELGSYFTLADGTRYYISTFEGSGTSYELVNQGTIFTLPVSSPIYLSTGYFLFSDAAEGCFYYYDPTGTLVGQLHMWRSMLEDGGYACFGFSPSSINITKYPFCFYTRPYNSSLNSWCYFSMLDKSFIEEVLGVILSADESLSLDVSDTMQEVLDRLTALEEGQSIALDVGATQSMEIQDILQGILDAILAGDLAASAEVVDEAVEPVEPDPPVVPVVPEGLDKLGAALTSRFPFSIPWDVYKGVTLLAAPPKAPYFEVDFMAPIADRVGGWQG